jgi:hypothetical protein
MITYQALCIFDMKVSRKKAPLVVNPHRYMVKKLISFVPRVRYKKHFLAMQSKQHIES